MAFNMGFDFRSTSGFVTDPAYGVPVLSTNAYPHTFTNANGDSVNAGWNVISSDVDRSASNDPRLAGVNYASPGVTGDFRIDLSSGSAPGATDYLVDLAAGDNASARTFDAVLVKDNTTTLITVSGTTSAANNYLDSTSTNRAPGTGAWTGVMTPVTFSTTTGHLTFTSAGDFATMAHFRLLEATTFDMGFDFRGSSGFVTDPAYGVPVLLENYPHTYTNANGHSVNAGRQSTGGFTIDTVNTHDPRIAGANYAYDNSTGYFQVDLGSGSAPGAGDYSTDIACGYTAGPINMSFILKDNSTTLIDGTNGGSGFSMAADQYLDASLAQVTATTTWTGTPVDVTFATTTVKLFLQPTSQNTFAAHFRLTEATTPPPTGNPWLQYRLMMNR